MSSKIKKKNNVISIIEKITVFISGTAIMAMMLLITSDVIARGVFSVSVTGAYEFSEAYLMPLAVFPTLLFVFNSKTLPRLDFITSKVNIKISYGLHLFFLILEILVFSFISWVGMSKAIAVTQEKLSFNAQGSMYPLYPIYYLVPLGFGLLVIGLVVKFIIAIKNSKQIEEYLYEVE